MWREFLFKRKVLNPRFNFYLDKIIKFNFSIFDQVFFNLKNMPKYTEDDLKSNSKLKNISTVYTELEADTFPIGLNEDIVRAISMRKEEPQWMTDGVSSLFVLGRK
jgi:hypothetical protein